MPRGYVAGVIESVNASLREHQEIARFQSAKTPKVYSKSSINSPEILFNCWKWVKLLYLHIYSTYPNY